MDPKREELLAIDGMIAEAEIEALEIGQALKRASGIVGRTLEQNMVDVNRRYEALCKRQDELQSDIGKAKLSDEAIQDTILFSEDVRMGIKNADFATKRRRLETFKVNITIQDRRFEVTSLVGTWDGEIRKFKRGFSGDDFKRQSQSRHCE